MAPTNIKFSDYKKIVFFTGAGLSAESGIATYRGPGGRWVDYDWKEYACQNAFIRDPNKVWDFHDARRVEASTAQPNAAHQVIADLQRSRPADVTVVTQNIDGLLQRAGAPDVIELHGSLWSVFCVSCGSSRRDFSLPVVRQCLCGETLRPDIVWFGDWLDPRLLQLTREAISSCDLLVSVGTSGTVQPAGNLPRFAPISAMTVEVNVTETSVSYMYKKHLHGTASDILSQMMT
jgi:NAD-dependent deacetylase